METEEVKEKLASVMPIGKDGRFELWLGEVVGFLELEIKDSEIVLDNIYVRSEHRGRGSGDFMLDMLKGISETSRYIITGIIEANGGAGERMESDKLKSWYERRGFKIEKNNRIVFYPNSLYSI